MERQTDILIIGAGIAGLVAARELKRHGLSYAVLEAQEQPGGRALTIHTPSGVAVDLGGHWLHGNHNPLKDLVDEYKLPSRRDTAQHTTVYQNGRVHRVKADWLEQAVDPDKAKRILKGKAPDCPLPDLAREGDNEGREWLTAFARMWDALPPPLMPSAREFLTDRNTPGGLQIKGGMGCLISKLVEDIGPEHVHCNTPISAMASSGGGVRVTTQGGEEWHSYFALFTPSFGVLTSDLVQFTPPLCNALWRDMAQMRMGLMNKIIVQLHPAFFAGNNIWTDTSFELIDWPSHFCHVRSAGAPLLTLFVSGLQAMRIEKFTGAEALDYLCHILSRVTELRGLGEHIVGQPIVTRWVSNPYTRGSYAALLPGGERSWPRREGNVWLCGDTFDRAFPASMAGAARSGKAAALLAIEALQGHRIAS